MRIEYLQNAELVRPLLERWEHVCRAEEYGFTVCVDAAIDDLQRWLGREPGTLICGYDGDEMIGFLAVFAINSTIGPDRVAIEKYWYADPNHKFAGPRLFNAAADWARDNGCSHLIVAASNLSSLHHDSVARFCEKLGMHLFETTYICEV